MKEKEIQNGRRKRRRKTNQQKLMEIADTEWKLAVFRKYGYKCELCGEPSYTAHHFYPKGICKELRYEVPNGVPICNKHHMAHHLKFDPSIHLLIVANRGKGWLSELMAKKKIEVYPSAKYYKDKIKRLQKY